MIRVIMFEPSPNLPLQKVVREALAFRLESFELNLAVNQLEVLDLLRADPESMLIYGEDCVRWAATGRMRPIETAPRSVLVIDSMPDDLTAMNVIVQAASVLGVSHILDMAQIAAHHKLADLVIPAPRFSRRA
jgi:hypothetical protein